MPPIMLRMLPLVHLVCSGSILSLVSRDQYQSHVTFTVRHSHYHPVTPICYNEREEEQTTQTIYCYSYHSVIDLQIGTFHHTEFLVSPCLSIVYPVPLLSLCLSDCLLSFFSTLSACHFFVSWMPHGDDYN